MRRHCRRLARLVLCRLRGFISSRRSHVAGTRTDRVHQRPAQLHQPRAGAQARGERRASDICSYYIYKRRLRALLRGAECDD